MQYNKGFSVQDRGLAQTELFLLALSICFADIETLHLGKELGEGRVVERQTKQLMTLPTLSEKAY